MVQAKKSAPKKALKLPALAEFERKQDIGKLGMPVGQRVAVVGLQREVVETNTGIRRSAVRCAAGDDHDATLPGEEQAIEETIYEHEMTEVIDAEVFLHAIDELAVVAASPVPGVEYQYVDG